MDFPYGEIVEPPKDFVPPEQWEEYRVAETLPDFARAEKVGQNPVGVRWGVWPLTFEEYVSDIEPDLSLSDPEGTARNRLIIWRRLNRRDNPKGWRRLPSRTQRVVGFFRLYPNETYTSRWSESARRSLRKWQEIEGCGAYSIERIDIEEFETGYLLSTIDKNVRKSLLSLFKRKIKSDTEGDFVIWGVRDKSAGTVVSGICVINSIRHKSSIYYCGFITEEAEKTHGMVGLMNRWFQESRNKKFDYLHFGPSWAPGNPASWKGFSLFKAKFGLSYIHYTQTLVRIMRGKFF
ncbi:MAG TPA: hypothetical protein VJH69_00935 [Candidatus Paceibacterota bacterium]